HHTTGDDQQREPGRSCRTDDGEGAACPPKPFVLVERAREEGQPHDVTESRRRKRVDQRADAVTGTGVEPTDAATDEPDPGAPGTGRPDQRAQKTDAREPKPDRPCVLDPDERAPHLRT